MRTADLRNLAIEWLREYAPGSIIVPELSVADFGAASVDLGAVSETHIIGVEIKGETDSSSRLDRQGITYGMVAREMWLLCSPKTQNACFARLPSGWGRLEVHDGRVRPFNAATKVGDPISLKDGHVRYPTVRDDSQYRPDRYRQQEHQTPWAMCGTLWRDELYEIARSYQLFTRTRSATVLPLTKAICDGLPVTIIHDEMIKALRKRVWRKRVIDTRTQNQAPKRDDLLGSDAQPMKETG